MLSIQSAGGRDIFNNIAYDNNLVSNFESYLFSFLYAISKDNKIIGGDYLAVCLYVFGLLQTLAALLNQIRPDYGMLTTAIKFITIPINFNSELIDDFSPTLYYVCLAAVLGFVAAMIITGGVYGYYFSKGAPHFLFPLRVLRLAISMLLSVIIIPALNILLYPISRFTLAATLDTALAAVSGLAALFLILSGLLVSLIFFDRSLAAPSVLARRHGSLDVLFFLVKVMVTLSKYVTTIPLVKIPIVTIIAALALTQVIGHVVLMPYIRRWTAIMMNAGAALVFACSATLLTTSVSEAYPAAWPRPDTVMWAGLLISCPMYLAVPVSSVALRLRMLRVTSVFRGQLERLFHQHLYACDDATPKKAGITFDDESSASDTQEQLEARHYLTYSTRRALPRTTDILAFIQGWPEAATPPFAPTPTEDVPSYHYRLRATSVEHAIRFLAHTMNSDARLRAAVKKLQVESVENVRGVGDKGRVVMKAYMTPLDRFVASDAMQHANRHNAAFHALRGKLRHEEIVRFIPRRLRRFGTDVGRLYCELNTGYEERARLLLRIADDVVQGGVKMFPTSPSVALLRADFLREYGGILYGATKRNLVAELDRCGRQRPTPLQRFHLYTYQRAFEDTEAGGLDGLAGATTDFMTRLDFSRKLRTAHRAHKRCVLLLHKFWVDIAAEDFVPAMHGMVKFTANESTAMDTYRALIRKFPERKDLYREFGVFLEEVCDDGAEAAKLFAMGDIAEEDEGAMDMGTGFATGMGHTEIATGIGKKKKRDKGAKKHPHHVEREARAMSDASSSMSSALTVDDADSDAVIGARRAVDRILRWQVVMFHVVFIVCVAIIVLVYPVLFFGANEFTEHIAFINDLGRLRVASVSLALSTRDATTAAYHDIHTFADFQAARASTAGSPSLVQAYSTPTAIVSAMTADVATIRAVLDTLHVKMKNDVFTMTVSLVTAPIRSLVPALRYPPDEVFFQPTIPTLSRLTSADMSFFDMGSALAQHADEARAYVTSGYPRPLTEIEARSLLWDGPHQLSATATYLNKRFMVELAIISVASSLLLLGASVCVPIVTIGVGVGIFRSAAARMTSSRAIAMTMFAAIPKGIVQDRIFMYDKRSRKRFADDEQALMSDLIEETDMLVTGNNVVKAADAYIKADDSDSDSGSDSTFTDSSVDPYPQVALVTGSGPPTVTDAVSVSGSTTESVTESVTDDGHMERLAAGLAGRFPTPRGAEPVQVAEVPVDGDGVPQSAPMPTTGMTFEQFKALDDAEIQNKVYNGEDIEAKNARLAEQMKAAKDGAKDVDLKALENEHDSARQVTFGMAGAVKRLQLVWTAGLCAVWVVAVAAFVTPVAMFLLMQWMPSIIEDNNIRQSTSMMAAHAVREAQLNATIATAALTSRASHLLGVAVQLPPSTSLIAGVDYTAASDLPLHTTHTIGRLKDAQLASTTGLASSELFSSILLDTDVHGLTYSELPCHLPDAFIAQCATPTISDGLPYHRAVYYSSTVYSYGIDGVVRKLVDEIAASATEERTGEMATAIVRTDAAPAMAGVTESYVDAITSLASGLRLVAGASMLAIPLAAAAIYIWMLHPVIAALRLQSRIGIRLTAMIPHEMAETEFVAWDESFATGIELFDRQHRKLFSLINDLHKGMVLNDPGLIDGVLRGLINYTVVHFETEARLFREHGYPRTAAHLVQHDAFTDQMKDFFVQHQNGQVDVDLKLLGFLRTWLIAHIKKEDFKYVPFMKTNVPEFKE